MDLAISRLSYGTGRGKDLGLLMCEALQVGCFLRETDRSVRGKRLGNRWISKWLRGKVSLFFVADCNDT